LQLGELDRQRGVMTEQQIALFASTAQTLIGNLAEIAIEEQAEYDPAESITGESGEGKSVLCIGGRGAIDDAAASMIAQVLLVQGATVSQAGHTAVSAGTFHLPRLTDIDTVIIAFLNASSKAHARQAVRRLKRHKPSVRVGIMMTGVEGTSKTPLTAEDIDADFVVSTISDAVRDALTTAEAVGVKTIKRPGRSREPKTTPLVA